MKIHFKETQYGFEYGALEIDRLHNDKGRVWVRLKTPKKSLDVYVTKTGKIRIFDGTEELSQ